MRLGDSRSAIDWLPLIGDSDILDLRNTRVGSLSDNKNAWPERGRLRLDGFTFARLGGYQADYGASMIRQRGAEWWDSSWARLDGDFSPSPYEQLAAAFTAAGDRAAGDEIRYDEQVRAGQNTKSWGAFAWSQLLRWGAGYGIGLYMFRALYIALALALLGAVVLRFWVKSVGSAGHGFFWCFGASVNRLLPVLTLKKEFTDFFDNPGVNQFTPWQDFFFVTLAVLGWVLGAIVIAAIATITHTS